MRGVRVAVLTTILVAMAAAPAFADLTGFIGANFTPENRRLQGVAAGAGLLIIGLEFEYATSPDDPKALAPKLTTGMGNVLIQPPFAIFGLQPYFTTGAGLYRETLGTHEDTGFVLNTGGGVKISLVGPLRVRVDYRVLKLGSDALHSPAHRLYAGLNLKF